MEIKDKVLLETKDGFRLLSDRFVDGDGMVYLIKDMKHASMKEGSSWRADGLLIEFKGGESSEFFFKSLPTSAWERWKRAMIASFTMGNRGVIMTVARDVQAQITEWATNINTLIDAQNSQSSK